MSDAAWPAPAKLNLFLHVTGRRPDGYHELETLFQIVDLADELRIGVRGDGTIARQGANPGVDASLDLAVRAARLLRERAGTPALGADLEIRKRIPLGAGLGGGSSDAATTLVALNALWGLGLAVGQLAELGRELGADVPVFVRGENAIGRGIGERLEPVELPPLAYAIVYPGTSVSTAEVFQAPELTRNSSTITMRGLPSPAVTSARLPGRNDLESVVRARYPAVRAALDWLGARATARLTGSGGSVFAAFADRPAAQAALRDLPAGWSGFAVEGLRRSPLGARLAAERGARDAPECR